MILRTKALRRLRGLLSRHPVVAILGARQIGKTTLARQLQRSVRGPTAWFDLENPKDAARLADPMLTLEPLKGLIVLDEIQRRPDLFSPLRVLVDQRPSRRKFLILGSASPELLRQSSESLAGRIARFELRGLDLAELGVSHLQRLWLRGGFPKSFLAKSESASAEWRREFVATFLERDLPALGIAIPATTLRRFWSMLAHYHGQLWNSSDFARSFGVADHTVRRYLDILTSTFLVRQLLPWHENLGKRQVKAPKIYVADTGLLHCLLELETLEDVEKHPKLGASWEGFALEVVTQAIGARPSQCFFWATHSGAELDLLVVHGHRRLGFEIKRTSSPSVTPSMRIALEDLKLARLDVIYAGEKTFPLASNIRAVPLRRVMKDLPPLR